jgi:Fic family protein
MARKVSTDNLNSVADIIRQNGGGARLEEILSRVQESQISRRTIQRWLKDLVSKGQVKVEGRGRATVYRIPESKPATASTNLQGEISLSLPALEILEYVQRPLAARQPVAYDRSFLDRYIPNETWYLTEVARKNLNKIGNTGELERPAGTYGREILNRLLIDLSWASSRLEGNTYDRLDTERLIEFGEKAEGKDAQEAQMILNHKAAIEMLLENINEVGFNSYTILNLHGILSEGLLNDPDASGRLRLRPVDIGQSTYKPFAVPQLIEALFREILEKANRIKDPFEQSFFALVHLPYLQPFDDVNKRVSRLAANIPLLKDNFCPLTFLGVPRDTYINAMLGVYEMTRVELLSDVFIWAYERSAREYLAVRESFSDPDPVRLRYAKQIHNLVGGIVRTRNANALSVVDSIAEQQIPEQHRTSFTQIVMDDLRRLHEGVLARYGLRPAEFDDWRKFLADQRTKQVKGQ